MQSGDMVQPRSCAYIRPPSQPYSLTGLHFHLVYIYVNRLTNASIFFTFLEHALISSYIK